MTATPEALPCPWCGEPPTIERDYVWQVICHDCYDGAPDAGPQLYAHDNDRAKAIECWNDEVLDALALSPCIECQRHECICHERNAAMAEDAYDAYIERLRGVV